MLYLYAALLLSAPMHSTIFNTLVEWWLKKYSYGPAITKLAKPLVAATLDVYALAQAVLLPTPTKSHYVRRHLKPMHLCN